MREAASPRTTRIQFLVAGLAIVAAVAALIVGRVAVSALVAVVASAAYVDARRLLAEKGHPSTVFLGALATLAFVWTGHAGDLELLPTIAAALILALLVARIALYESATHTGGVVADIAATLGAAGVVGVLCAHILLVRAVPRWGGSGLVALVSMAIVAGVAAFFVGRLRGRHPLNRHVAPTKTWEGAFAGFVASVAVGGVFGVVANPPFDMVTGIVFGAGVGVLVAFGDLAFSAIKRSAGVKRSGGYLGAAGGVLDLVDGLLFAAPAFYWAFRTIAL